MNYTETVYRMTDSEYLCRILDYVSLGGAIGECDAVLTVDMYGKKIVYKADEFQELFYVFDAGETPAALMQKDENGNN